VNIRLAEERDWPALWSIIATVIKTGDTYTLEPDASEAAAKKYWVDDVLETWVAEEDGEVVGTYVLRANQRGLGSHVSNVGYMVRPGYGGRGIGMQLGEHSLANAKKKGFQAMQFNAVVSTNTRAVELWKRLGFTIIGTVPKGFRHQALGLVDLYVMHRFL
jgi:GNAT superfamily N-acetyltransferase